MFVSYVLEFYQVTDNILEFLCMSLIKDVNYLQNLKHKSISNVKSKTGRSCLLMCDFSPSHMHFCYGFIAIKHNRSKEDTEID